MPVVIGSTSTSITLTIGNCEDNGGASLDHYTIYRDAGALQSAYEEIFTGLFENDFTYVAIDLTPGLLYHFKASATNRIGESDYSSEASFYAADVPS